jgi:SAM-dependent methyltransferase
LAPCYLDRFSHVVLYDGSLSLLRQAKDFVQGRALCVAGDIGHLPFKKASFDTVLTIRVLQHVHELEGTFLEMRRIISGEGRLVFSYHNKRNAHRILNWLISRKIASPFSKDSKEVSPTLISHHPDLIKKIILNAGFSLPFYQGTAIINALADMTDKFAGRRPAGQRWARFMGKFRLAPWLIGRATAEDGEALRPGNSLEDVLQCPACHGDLGQSAQSYECKACRRDFPVLDGILDFRL